ncbi:MAG: sensor histidine kinase [Chitinophagaceae bacterium]|nr:sensor histidine kinase [Chitinophagaceae bacterium]
MEANENNFFSAILIIAILIGIVLTYFIITILRYHRRYINLQKERIHAEIIIQENERKRIATDLHDSIGPLLSSVKLQINSIDVASSEDLRVINNAGKHLDEIIGSMREISYNLLPNTLQRKGLTEALREFVANIKNRHGTNINLYFKNEINLASEKEIHVFRIIQEIIHNTIKHAHAKNLQLGFGCENGELLILTQDDGTGFDVEKVKKVNEGFGMKSIESRVDILKGYLNIQAEPPNGTSYFIKIPM